MKMNASLRILLSTAGIALLSAFTVGGQETRFYVRGDAGGAWTPDADVKAFLGSQSPGSKVKFDPGIRFGFAAGYHVTDWFAAEAETGVMACSIDSITGIGATSTDASFANVPFLINARFQCPTPCRLTPYVGGGLGASATVLDVDHIDFDGGRLRGSQSTAVFAYQAFAGLRYKLNEQMGLSLEYHYFATTEPKWRVDFTAGPDTIRFGGIETHAVSIAFDYNF